MHSIALQGYTAPEPSDSSDPSAGASASLGSPVLQAVPTEQAPDISLVVAAQRDPAAFDAIYARYLTRLYRYVRAFIWNDEDAADVTQLVFLKAFEALPRYEARAAPFAVWLFRIARNTSMDARRRKRTQGHAPDEYPRQLLALRFAAGLSATEIAEVVGKRPDAVKKRITRTLQALKEQFYDAQAVQ